MAKQHQPNRKRRVLNPADVREACHEIMPIGDGAMPDKAVGWTDLRGRWTRMEVTYPNGWVLSVGFDRNQKVRDVTSRLKVIVRKPA